MVAAARDHVAMVRSPDRWPAWPYLPVKRGHLPDADLGIVLASETTVLGDHPTVYLINLFALPRTPDEWAAAPKMTYPSAEAMVADGWVVD